MLPLMAAAFGSQALGNILGGISSTQGLSRGLAAYRDAIDKGNATLEAGKTGSTAAFNPYSSTGEIANAAQLGAIQDRTQAAQPTLSNLSPEMAAQFLSPQAGYQQGQAMKSAMAAGSAGGAMGGGMLKALQTNANKLAQGSWNDAYSNMLNTANLNFGQQQQQYQNKTGYDQSQIENYSGLANRGLQAIGQNQANQLAYNHDINANFGDLGNAAYQTAVGQGNIWGKTMGNLGNLASNAFSYFGG